MNGIEFLVRIAERAAAHPEEYLKGGSNGPYVDNDTKVRCCSHWLITFSKCFEWTGAVRFREKTLELADFLCSKDARPFGYTFHCRDRRNNQCNGLIGTAWVLEALAEATSLLGDPEYSRSAREVALLHPFDERRALWRRVEVDGRVFPIECTFNHQLWFAACASMLLDSGKAATSVRVPIRSQIRTFLDNIESNLSLHDNGMIDHLIRGTDTSSVPTSFRQRLSRLVRLISQDQQRQPNWKYSDRTRFQQSAGYHAFNMFGFALLRRRFPCHPFWRSRIFATVRDYLLSDEHTQNLESNRFGYAYNPIGFEVPFAVASTTQTQCDESATFAEIWINKQLREHYNSKTMKMDRNTDDSITLTARLYELARIEPEVLSRVHVAGQ